MINFTVSKAPGFAWKHIVIPICEDVTVGIFPWAILPECSRECYTDLAGVTQHVSSCEKFFHTCTIDQYYDYITCSKILSLTEKEQVISAIKEKWLGEKTPEIEIKTETKTADDTGAGAASSYVYPDSVLPYV